MRNTMKGRYVPRNPEKYVGNIRNIRYLSSWEFEFMQFLDNNPNVIRWASEEVKIPYVKPTDGKVHTYYPDFWVELKNRQGEIVQEIIEVKPAAQARQPTRVGKNKKTQLYETIQWEINKAKWKACQQFCDKYNIKFRIVTEKHLYR